MNKIYDTQLVIQNIQFFLEGQSHPGVFNGVIKRANSFFEYFVFLIA